MSQNCEMRGCQWQEVKRIKVFAKNKIVEKGLGHLFITSRCSHFFNKIDFEQYLLKF